MSIRVRLQPQTVQMDPVPTNRSLRYTVVHALTVRLEVHGRGPNPTNTTPVPAKLEFFEVPRPRDSSQQNRLIATRDGQFRMDGTTPKLDFVLSAMTLDPVVDGSDFRVTLEWDTGTIENAINVTRLILPWEVSEERNVIEVGVVLTIDGNVHAALAVNDRADIPLQHNRVPRDGSSTTEFVAQRTTAEATAPTAPWAGVPAGGPVIARNVTDPLALAPADGVDIPFFDFWVFYDNPPINSGESGQSEMLNPNNPFNRTARTKRVISPIALVSGGAAGTFDSVYPQVNSANAMNFLADLIAHEIGHTFGFEHGLLFEPGTSSYTPSSASFRDAMTNETVVGGAIPLKRWGPVHRQVLRTHFL